MLIERIQGTPDYYNVNCYLVADEATRAAMAIDPAVDTEAILSWLRNNGLTLTAIVNTHGHYDHLGGIEALRKATGVPLIAHPADADMLLDAELNYSASLLKRPFGGIVADRLVDEGDEIVVGNLRFKVLHTPGHSRGGICLLCDDHLFSGDTLMGGTQYHGGSDEDLSNSLRRLVHPGHGRQTTMAEEKANPPLSGFLGVRQSSGQSTVRGDGLD